MRAIILAANGVEECELIYPYYRLQEAGISVDIAAPERGLIQGRHRCQPIEAKVSFFDMWGAEYYDIVVLPGAAAAEAIRHDERAQTLVRDMLEAGKIVAAVGHGVETLVSAGVVEGRKATCAEGVRDELQLAGAEYLDQPVVVDGNLITGRGVDDLPDFWREVMRAVDAASNG